MTDNLLSVMLKTKLARSKSWIQTNLLTGIHRFNYACF